MPSRPTTGISIAPNSDEGDALRRFNDRDSCFSGLTKGAPVSLIPLPAEVRASAGFQVAIFEFAQNRNRAFEPVPSEIASRSRGSSCAMQAPRHRLLNARSRHRERYPER